MEIAMIILVSVLYKAGTIGGTTFGWCLALTIVELVGRTIKAIKEARDS